MVSPYIMATLLNDIMNALSIGALQTHPLKTTVRKNDLLWLKVMV